MTCPDRARLGGFAGSFCEVLFQEQAYDVCSVVVNQEQFCACILADAYLSKGDVPGLLSAMKPKALEKTAFYITAPDKGKYYEGNGNAHMVMRDMELPHEYRVSEGNGGFELFLSALPEIIAFTEKRFHK